jgi:SAM-dependent methyltransferase
MSKYLNWIDRSKAIERKIKEVFEDLGDKSGNQWSPRHRGINHEPYGMCELNEYELLVTKILSNRDQKQFNLLDLGAGDFGFARGLLEFLRSAKIPQDVKVSIISVRGEPHQQSNQYKNTSKFQSIELGKVIIENIIEEAEVKNIKFDLIVSKYTLRHCVDGAGLILQLHKMLAPNGILVADGFYLGLDKFKIEDRYSYLDILLSHLPGQDSLIIKRHYGEYDFIIHKGAFDSEFKIPWEYPDAITAAPPHSGILHSNCFLIFRSLEQIKKDVKITEPDSLYKAGSFDWGSLYQSCPMPKYYQLSSEIDINQHFDDDESCPRIALECLVFCVTGAVSGFLHLFD